jgi:hypothetical protein
VAGRVILGSGKVVVNRSLESGHETRAIEILFDTLAALDLELALRPRSGEAGGPRPLAGRHAGGAHPDPGSWGQAPDRLRRDGGGQYPGETPLLSCSPPTPEPARSRAFLDGQLPKAAPFPQPQRTSEGSVWSTAPRRRLHPPGTLRAARGR